MVDRVNVVIGGMEATDPATGTVIFRMPPLEYRNVPYDMWVGMERIGVDSLSKLTAMGEQKAADKAGAAAAVVNMDAGKKSE